MTSNSKVEPRSECVISNVLEVLGDKWTLLVIRDLALFNKHEYKEFLASPEAIATNILADRLKRLLASGIIAERAHPDSRSRKIYYLTEKGKALLPILLEMAKWGSRYFPDLKAMQPLYERLSSNEPKLKREILKQIEEWEKENLPIPC